MICVLCPTRGRPDNVTRLLDSILATACYQVQVVFYFDEDDTTGADTRAILRRYEGDIAIQYVVGSRIVLSHCWNRCYECAGHKSNVFFQCGDDIVFRSQWWDVEVEETFERYEDRIVLVHGRDGVHDERFGTHCFLSRRWINTVGVVVPPFYNSDWADQVLNDIGNELGRRVFLPNVYTEHLHPDVGKAVRDQTHLDRMERGALDNVWEIYHSPMQAEWTAEAVRKLREVCEAYT